MEQFVCAGVRSGGKLLFRLLREFKLAQRNKLQTIFRANIHAATAEDALASIGFGSFEDRVDPALQAARGFKPRLFFGESRFDFGDPGAALERNGRDS